MLKLTEPRSTYIVDYQTAVDYTDKQVAIFWPPNEIKVEKDVQDIRVNLTEAERHGVITTLKLFTQYELIVGDEYWKQVGEMFQKPACVTRMANCFGFFELNVHAPFYSKINEALGLANDKFYTEYVNDPLLKDRVDTLEKYADVNNPYEFLIMLALAEGVILYSSFAFLKHFQSQGKNKINNIVRGINFSTRDEGLHSEASAWLFRTLAAEEGADLASLEATAYKLAQTVREHEYAIVDMIFSKGSIEGITDVQMKHFVDSRVNLVLRNLGFNNLYAVSYNPIADWFYDGINNYVSNDFFAGVGREYVRTWDEEELAW